MNAPAITTRVADLVRNPNSAMPSEWERSSASKTKEPSSKDPSKTSEYKVDFSPLAQKILEESDLHESHWEKNRDEHVQRIQQLVQEKRYTLSPEIVDSVAQKIVAMLP